MKERDLLFRIRVTAALLMVAGALVMIGGCVAPAAVLWSYAAGTLPTADEVEPWLLTLGLMVVFATGLMTLVAGTVIIVGGYRMFQVRSRRLAIVAAVVAILSSIAYLFTGVLAVFGWLAFPVGVWTLLLLTRPSVKAVFEERTRA